ncbi:hypothetical protein DSCW_07160 [Desulfosarcina widdelii]|uniref:Uncharacterized protein n=1 Tax=Desulfosarcina widdelii TaxID=947919 RepID=A0A5K7YZ85_9BACT|nr:hypothetical protein [Desulfosarcina widdelii]BBO73299.1 hypothetical protein DSCW_07160 [Desulfosarcina widdelii]
MPKYTVAHSRKINSNIPSLNEWERFSGGPGDRNNSLLKAIDKNVYEHFIYYRNFVARGENEVERLCCLIQLWMATDLYIKSYKGKYRTKTVGIKGPTSNPFAKGIDGGTNINLPTRNGDNSPTLRIDAVEALETIVARELMVLTGAPSKAALKATIKDAQLCQLSQHGLNVDKGPRIYLNKIERAEHRILFGNKVAKMRDPQNPAQWIDADTLFVKRGPCGSAVMEVLKSQPKEFITDKGPMDLRACLSRFTTGLSGHCGFVMTHGRKFFMETGQHKAQNKGTGEAGFFHSAYTAGEGVLCSGSIVFRNGKPLLLTNLSGHYQPPPRKLEHVIRLFETAEVPLNELNILTALPGDKYGFYDNTDLNEFRSTIKGRMADAARTGQFKYARTTGNAPPRPSKVNRPRV